MVVFLNKITELSKSRWTGHVVRAEELVNMYRVIVRKETHGRPSDRWETILKIMLKNIISGYVFWICVAKFRVM